MVDLFFVLGFCSVSLFCLDQLGLWEQVILKHLGTDLFTHHFWATYIIINAVFYSFGLFLAYFDLKNTSVKAESETGIERYKIQPGTNAPLSKKRFLELISLVSFNQLVIGGITQYIFCPIHIHVNNITKEDILTLPSIYRILAELAFFTVIDEILFFYSHWALHSRLLYGKFHKIHHEWTATVSLAASYMHPFEFVISDSIPNRIGPLICGSHPVTIWIWHIVANMFTINSHSGYHLPFLPSNENHDYHHKRFNVNYGSLGILDEFHGTDALFKKSKEFNRHVTLTSLKSARELIPDD